MDRFGWMRYYGGMPEYNYEKLRKDLEDECLGAMFAGGFGMAMVDMAEIERASDEQLLKYAKEFGLNLKKYQV